MRVLAIALALCAVVVPVGGAQVRVSDRDRERLQGPVRSVRIDVARVEQKRGVLVEGKRVPALTAAYNANGDQVEQTRFVGGEAVERTSYQYTPEGVQVSQTLVKSSGAVFALVSTASEAPAGTRTAPSWRTDRRLTKFTYDSDGLRREATAYDEIGRDEIGIARETFEYDAEGRLARVRRASYADGSPIETTEYTYRKCGELAQLDVLRGDGALERRVSYDGYRCDARGNWVRRTEVESFGNGTVRERRVAYRAIMYFEERATPAARRDAREAAATARRRTGSPASGDVASTKAKGRETPTMDDNGLFVAVFYANRYNEEKRADGTTVALVDRESAGRPRRVLKRRRAERVEIVEIRRTDVETPAGVVTGFEPDAIPAR